MRRNLKAIQRGLCRYLLLAKPRRFEVVSNSAIAVVRLHPAVDGLDVDPGYLGDLIGSQKRLLSNDDHGHSFPKTHIRARMRLKRPCRSRLFRHAFDCTQMRPNGSQFIDRQRFVKIFIDL